MNTDTLGKVTRTERGFELIEFEDRYQIPCSLQASSLDDYPKPGTSAVWLGVDDGHRGFRMHLDRERVRQLIWHLQQWLHHGSFE